MRWLALCSLSVLYLLACSDGASTSLCQDDGRESSLFAACVMGPSIEEPVEWPGVHEFRIEGVVEDIGEGGTAECFAPWFGRLGDWVDADDPELDAAEWISLRNAEGELHRVEVITPGGFQWSAAVGERLVVDFRQQPRGFIPTNSSLEVREKGADLVYWVSIVWQLEELQPPAELELADGGEGCLVIGPDCNARWEERSLSASVDGETGLVAYGAHSSVGPLTVLNHAYEVNVGQVDCADYFVGTVEVAAWPK